ncbi:MAG: hypothetical protein RIQ82_1345 [Bacteroidota bacterium]|jgi:hypothetical protein
MNIDKIIDNLHESALILQGLDDCVLGHDDEGILIYSYKKMYDHFSEQMSSEEAIEWIDYNVMGVKPNGKGFIICYDLD